MLRAISFARRVKPASAHASPATDRRVVSGFACLPLSLILPNHVGASRDPIALAFVHAMATRVQLVAFRE
jgi:hypothetical protein